MIKTTTLLTAVAMHISHAALADDFVLFKGVARAGDGDGLYIGPLSVRLHGIDAPETEQTCTRADGTEWPCGRVAKQRMEELVGGQLVECRAFEIGVYRRLIAHCFVDGVDVNETMVLEGLAWAFTRYSDDFVEQESVARVQGVGVFESENMTPWEWRDQAWERAIEASPDGCPIKGNINRNGVKIYHTPFSPYYDAVKIDESKGQKWFCDEEDAMRAGWRAPFR